MPASFVAAVRRTPVSVCVSVTLARFTTAPEGSVIVPDTVPRLVWACAATASVRIAVNGLMILMFPRIEKAKRKLLRYLLLRVHQIQYRRLIAGLTRSPEGPHCCLPRSASGEMKFS